MPITTAELGRRIRVAREAGGLTQDQVAEHVGIARSAVTQIEAGRRSVSSVELVKLAHFFGRDVAEFVATTFQEEDPLAALFRADAEATDSPAVIEALRACMALGREFTNLERLLGIDRHSATAATYSWPVPVTRWDAIQQGQRLADVERQRLGLGAAPLADLVELLDDQGIRTGVIVLPPDVSGLTFFDRDGGAFIVVNGEHGRARRRFSFAHEFAHVLLDRARAGLVSRASSRADLLEVRANAFAAAFLMPEDGVRQVIAALGKGRPSRAHAEVFDEVGSVDADGRTVPGTQAIQLYDVVQLAHHFGVSRLSALYRLRNLKLITEPEFDALKALDDAGKGKLLAGALRLPEPDQGGAMDDLHRRFLALGLEAYRREEISLSKLRELGVQAGLTAAETDQMIDAGIEDDEASQT
jgi:Zn-dependent peptidase ImmA (M78 family)/DNA-binding XRE family transcriptional regulator